MSEQQTPRKARENMQTQNAVSEIVAPPAPRVEAERRADHGSRS